MQADHVEVSWDSEKSKWLVRIQVGEEVIRRYCSLPQNAAGDSLQQAVNQTLKEEGFEPAQAVNIQRMAS